MSLNGGGSREYNVQWAQQVSTDSDLLSSYIQCFILTQLNVITKIQLYKYQWRANCWGEFKTKRKENKQQ